jgi:hypothetical protein
MAKEAFYYPEEHTRLFADIISQGMTQVDVPEEISEQITEELDRMYAYAEYLEEDS